MRGNLGNYLFTSANDSPGTEISLTSTGNHSLGENDGSFGETVVVLNVGIEETERSGIISTPALISIGTEDSSPNYDDILPPTALGLGLLLNPLSFKAKLVENGKEVFLRCSVAALGVAPVLKIRPYLHAAVI